MAVACYNPQLCVPRATAEPALTPLAEASVSDASVEASRVLTGTCHTNLPKCYYSNHVCLTEIPV